MERFTAHRLQCILEYLPAQDAYRSGLVCHSWLKGQKALDARCFLQRIRPNTWAHEIDLNQDFCKALLRDWHLCLKESALQVAYVSFSQHLIYVDEDAKLCPPPQGYDPFPIDKDHERYNCLIEGFRLEHLWWQCLDAELFRWDQSEGWEEEETEVLKPELEPVPGYKGDMSLPNLQEDLLAVLSLNAAWFSYSFWTRQLQAILLLRDGRFLLVGSTEMQGTINSQASVQVLRCFVSDSLNSLVTLAQDPRSRELLGTSVGGEAKQLAMRMVRSPRVPHWDAEDHKEVVKQTFGEWREAKQSVGKVLFSKKEFCQEEARQNLKVGDPIRVKRRGETLMWTSCVNDWDVPHGPVRPDLEQEYIERAQREDRRWINYSGGCHLGLKNGNVYDGKVEEVNDGRCHVRYTNRHEWADGDSGFTGSRGGSRHHQLIEADVDLQRISAVPTNSWFQAFQHAWLPCGGFSSISNGFGDAVHSTRGFAGGSKPYERPAEADFSKLADVLADSLEAHQFRCYTLEENQESLSELPPKLHMGWPSPRDMAKGKELFLKLLRTAAYWEKWVAQGGESPAYVTSLFKKQRVVRLKME